MFAFTYVKNIICDKKIYCGHKNIIWDKNIYCGQSWGWLTHMVIQCTHQVIIHIARFVCGSDWYSLEVEHSLCIWKVKVQWSIWTLILSPLQTGLVQSKTMNGIVQWSYLVLKGLIKPKWTISALKCIILDVWRVVQCACSVIPWWCT